MKNKWFVFILVIIVMILIASPVVIAPTNESTQNDNITDLTNKKTNENFNKEDEKIDLNIYIPNKPKSTLIYNELMDSGIAMELQDIEKTDNSTKYIFLTFIQDGLGHIGIKGEDRTYYTIYEVTDTEIKEIVKNEINEKGFERTLLKFPLKEGNTWEGSFRHNNEEYKGKYEIIKIEGDKITVGFTANDVKDFYKWVYKEEYVIEKGKSITFLTKTLPWEENGQVVEAPFEFYRELYQLNTEGVQRKPYSTELDAYMPNKDNLKGTYYYHGIGEYTHVVELDNHRVNKGEDAKVYNFNGKVMDGRGFENPKFTATYIVDSECIYEEIETNYTDNPEETKYSLNSLRNSPVILKLPLRVGNQWEDSVVIDDVAYDAKTMITDISFNPYTGRNELITVTTAEVPAELGYRNNTYVETRTYAKGIGLVSFIKNNPGVKIDGKTEYYDFNYSLTKIDNNK